MEIQNFANNIYFKDGIWFSKNNREISYPQEGNMNCYEIEKDSFWFKHRNNCILTAVKIYSANDIFFDIGGGNGYVSKRLQENNIQTVLIEPGLVGALNAKERGLKNIICSTFEDAGIKSSSCQSIGLFDVVEHIEDDKIFLKSIHYILSDKGLVYITVPAFKALWSQEDDAAGHFRRYSIKQITSTLKDSGFEIEYATYIFSILPIPVFIFRTIPYLLGFNRKSDSLQKQKQEHSEKKGIISSVLNKIWNKEISYINQKKKILFGGSCFIIARKKVADT
jgi:2-polyprenyl-3-methyl-5-hydroxy-6-metoxy-1,4-benzoquinol methylase